MTVDPIDPVEKADPGWVHLDVRVPAPTAMKLAELAFRRGVSLSFLFDELASQALLEDEVARRLNRGDPLDLG